MWILGLKGLIWKRLFRGLNKVSLLLKINVLIKLVLWSFFGPKKEWQITWAHLRGGGYWECAAGWGCIFMTGLTNGVAFSIELLEWGCTFSGFLG